MLQQLEPPTFDGMSPVLSTAPGPMPSQVTKRMSKKPTYQVSSPYSTACDLSVFVGDCARMYVCVYLCISGVCVMPQH